MGDAQTTVKHRAVSIWLNRAEGPNAGTTEVTCTGEDVWRQAWMWLTAWSATAPESDKWGVHKTDFKVVYDDGTPYEGCFGLCKEDQDLPAHMRHHLEHILEHPEVPHYREMFDDVREFLDGYEIGDGRVHEL